MSTENKDRSYPLVIISDTHLGMKNAGIDRLCAFLEQIRCDTLILNGDIIDGERLAYYAGRKLGKTDMRVIEAFHALVERGTKVFYLPGNHDGALRDLDIFGKTIMGVTFADSLELTDPQGRRFLVAHGDRLNGPSQKKKKKELPRLTLRARVEARTKRVFYTAFESEKGVYAGGLIDKATRSILGRDFNATLGLARAYNLVNTFRFAVKRRDSFSSLKATLKRPSGEWLRRQALAKARREGFDGIICGHSHSPELHVAPDGIFYANSGDWVTRFTALAMGQDGGWRILAATGAPGRRVKNDNRASSPPVQAAIQAIHRIWGR